MHNQDSEPLGAPFNVPPGVLRPNGTYTIIILAEKGHFFHEIRLDDVPDFQPTETLVVGDKIKLGDHLDQGDVISSGSIGFAAIRGEHFAIGSLFVYPPGVNPLVNPSP